VRAIRFSLMLAGQWGVARPQRLAIAETAERLVLDAEVFGELDMLEFLAADVLPAVTA